MNLVAFGNRSIRRSNDSHSWWAVFKRARHADIWLFFFFSTSFPYENHLIKSHIDSRCCICICMWIRIFKPLSLWLSSQNSCISSLLRSISRSSSKFWQYKQWGSLWVYWGCRWERMVKVKNGRNNFDINEMKEASSLSVEESDMPKNGGKKL